METTDPLPTEAQPTINSTDATRGAPLAVRARARRDELAALREQIPAHNMRERSDIELALTTVDNLLTGDTENLADATARDLNKWLEQTKHLAEKPQG